MDGGMTILYGEMLNAETLPVPTVYFCGYEAALLEVILTW